MNFVQVADEANLTESQRFKRNAKNHHLFALSQPVVDLYSIVLHPRASTFSDMETSAAFMMTFVIEGSTPDRPIPRVLPDPDDPYITWEIWPLRAPAATLRELDKLAVAFGMSIIEVPPMGNKGDTKKKKIVIPHASYVVALKSTYKQVRFIAAYNQFLMKLVVKYPAPVPVLYGAA